MAQNVMVAVRCRPMSAKETAAGYASIVEITGNKIKISPPDASNKAAPKDFTFDFCYPPNVPQISVYNDLASHIITKALDGYNGTIFAYGQTGSGKTFTMMGGADNDSMGLIPRMNQDLFDKVAEKLVSMNNPSLSDHLGDGTGSTELAPQGSTASRSRHTKKLMQGIEVGTQRASSMDASDHNGDHKDGLEDHKAETKIMITASYLEIYNEEIKDLLNPSKKQLKLRESKDSGVYVEDLCELIVKDAAELSRLIQQGAAVRKVAATNMNEQSSRSHACFTIKVQLKTTSDMGNGVTREQLLTSKVNLVDLAGSERASKTGATGQTLKEGAKINLSLMTLGTVINALSGGSQHVPYRDSKLTFLLSESLGGNAATVMVAAISPANYNYDETLSTLAYANRAKSIENKVMKNENVQDRMIRQLKEEIEMLRAKLQASATAGATAGASGVSTAEADEALRLKLSEMEELQKNAWEEKERLSKQLEEERSQNMHAVMADMMHELKEQKIEHMKNLKRLQLEHETVLKKQDQTKAKSDEIRVTIMTSMKAYEKLQSTYNDMVEAEKGGASMDRDELANLTNEMATLLSNIEVDKQQWMALKEAMKGYRSRLETIAGEITDEEAKIVATKGILDENDSLRQRIQDEEREKAKERFESELANARAQLESEREQVRGNIEAEIRDEMTALQTDLATAKAQAEIAVRDRREMKSLLDASKAYADELEQRLSEAQADHEAAKMEVNSLQAELESKAGLEQRVQELESQVEQMSATHDAEVEDLRRQIAELDAIRRAQSVSGESDRYKIFRTLMDAFHDERSAMEKAYRDVQHLLSLATKDVLFLSQQNEALQQQINTLVYYEAPLTSSKPRTELAGDNAGGEVGARPTSNTSLVHPRAPMKSSPSGSPTAGSEGQSIAGGAHSRGNSRHPNVSSSSATAKPTSLSNSGNASLSGVGKPHVMATIREASGSSKA